jgi:hypothetical protein
MFNFPTERMAPVSDVMLDLDVKKSELGFICDGEEYTVDMEISKEMFFKAVSDGLGWSLGSFPRRIKEINGPYIGAYTIKCVSDFNLTALNSVEVPTVHEVSEELFKVILKYGLKTIMGNVHDVSIRSVFGHTTQDIKVTFRAKEHN